MNLALRTFSLSEIAITAFLSLSVHACGISEESASSNLKVGNGAETATDEFPATIMLEMIVRGGAGICTATFVNDQQAITAAHCVEGLAPSNPEAYFVNKTAATKVRALSYKRNPRYTKTIDNGVNSSDLALLTFPLGSAPAVAQLAAATPAVASELTIVGFGQDINFRTANGGIVGSGSGEKRKGSNLLRANEGGMLDFIGIPHRRAGFAAGTWVASGPGDSGGPMFVDGQLVGVTSGGFFIELEDGSPAIVSRYVDLNSAESQAFLLQNLR